MQNGQKYFRPLGPVGSAGRGLGLSLVLVLGLGVWICVWMEERKGDWEGGGGEWVMIRVRFGVRVTVELPDDLRRVKDTRLEAEGRLLFGGGGDRGSASRYLTVGDWGDKGGERTGPSERRWWMWHLTSQALR